MQWVFTEANAEQQHKQLSEHSRPSENFKNDLNDRCSIGVKFSHSII